MGRRVLYPSFAVAVKVIAREGIGPVRDDGLLASALERPSTTVMGAEAYPTIPLKAASLMHSLCLNHALVDGNKRIAALLAVMFLEVNGVPCPLTNDELFNLTMEIADGTTREIGDIADRLASQTR